MFTLVNGRKVISDEGFEVERGSGHPADPLVSYREGKKLLILEAEYDMPNPLPDDHALLLSLLEKCNLLIYIPNQLKSMEAKDAACTRWQEPANAECLSDEEQGRILGNIQRALQFKQERFRFVPL